MICQHPNVVRVAQDEWRCLDCRKALPLLIENVITPEQPGRETEAILPDVAPWRKAAR